MIIISSQFREMLFDWRRDQPQQGQDRRPPNPILHPPTQLLKLLRLTSPSTPEDLLQSSLNYVLCTGDLKNSASNSRRSINSSVVQNPVTTSRAGTSGSRKSGCSYPQRTRHEWKTYEPRHIPRKSLIIMLEPRR